MPVFDGLVGSPLPKKPLDLAFDPLTGECLSSIADTESVDSGRESEVIRKFSSDSCDDSSWKTDPERVNHGYNGVCKQEIEQLIPEQCVLECFIDPFTGNVKLLQFKNTHFWVFQKSLKYQFFNGFSFLKGKLPRINKNG